MSSEALGNRQILGLRAEGTRQTMTIPAGVFGNVGPIQVVTERWHSPELKIVLESRRSDPRLGDVDVPRYQSRAGRTRRGAVRHSLGLHDRRTAAQAFRSASSLSRTDADP